MSKLKFDHLYKSYEKSQVINDVSFEVDKKSFIVLAGPSGCGKTTLLEMVAGLVTIDKGSIYIDDECMNQVKPEKRDIAMVFQNAALFEHMSVFENIAIGLAYKGFDKEKIKTSVNQFASMMCIDDLLERKAKTLSSGQKQRVSIARALIRYPKVVLMDEALNALDARLKTQLRIELAQLYQKMNTTFVYVTHDQMEAMTLAEILIVMKDGAFQQIGKPMDIYQYPCNLFVADFIGKFEINQFHAKIIHQCIYFKGIKKRLHDAIEEQDIIIAVRPEHISLDMDEEGIQGRVVLIENVGDDIFYHISYDEGNIIVKGDILQHIVIYDQIRFSFSFDNALYFDIETQKRIIIN